MAESIHANVRTRPRADLTPLAELFAARLPRWVRVRQELTSAPLADPAAAVAAEFARPELEGLIRPGSRVALACGSRGIDRLGEVTAACVREVRRRGGEPFVVPAMGSHGGATAEGQRAVLAGYGVTPEAAGCPVRSSMEVVLLGTTSEGVPAWFDRLAAEADAVIPINRVKPHTDFHAGVESGLAKMIAIGLGKQRGADALHAQGFASFARHVPAVAAVLLERARIPFGVALIEDGRGQLSLLEAVPARALAAREPELLELARARMAKLPGDRIDVLVVDRIGKDISGIGADTNVVNRYYTGALPQRPVIQRLVVRDLTDASDGNASGLGLADVVLQRAVDRIDPLVTYMNCITAKTPEGARVPLTVPDDRTALGVALATCVGIDAAPPAIARIRDTKHLEHFWASESLAGDLRRAGLVTLEGRPQAIAFDADGMFRDA